MISPYHWRETSREELGGFRFGCLLNVDYGARCTTDDVVRVLAQPAEIVDLAPTDHDNVRLVQRKRTANPG